MHAGSPSQRADTLDSLPRRHVDKHGKMMQIERSGGVSSMGTQDTTNRRIPISVCFMVMPFGKKLTHADTGTNPAEINFDALWEKVFRPMIVEDLGFIPIRADQDAGALIIQTMIERLVISDLVLADMTISNANVYYEVGVRHAAQRQGCVLLAADWSKPLFDVAQMRRVQYSLTEGTISDEAAAAMRRDLAVGIREQMRTVCPVFQALPGFPNAIHREQLESFREVAGELAAFQAKVTVARGLLPSAANIIVSDLLQQYKGYAQAAPSMALDLIQLFRDNLQWAEGVNFIDDLDPQVRALPFVREQRALLLGKLGRITEAIIELETLVAIEGDSSERSGLLGGRYKSLYDRTFQANARRNYLDKAIACYERAMMLDLNDYYPSGNLPRLYRTRMRPGDAQKAVEATTLAGIACERALKRRPGDYWADLSMLGAAFDASNVQMARDLLGQLQEKQLPPFSIKSTLPDVRRSLLLNDDAAVGGALATVLGELERWLCAAGRVIAAVGRRIDAPNADELRFPADQEAAVSQRIRHTLVATACQAVVCSAACGSDILVLENAAKLSIRCRVVLPFSRDRFRAQSVADRGAEWGDRFDAIMKNQRPDDVMELHLIGDEQEAYAAANRKILDEALAWGTRLGMSPLAMIVWNEVTRGGTDMTDDFRQQAGERNIETVSVPTI
jgi:tetratricopeptide (TPR) repeat protein